MKGKRAWQHLWEVDVKEGLVQEPGNTGAETVLKSGRDRLTS